MGAKSANFWEGNRDIIKMNLSNPTNQKENYQGYINARNYLYGVASFWTETIQSDLILQTASMDNREKEKIANNNGISSAQLKEIKKTLADMRSPILEQNKTVDEYIREFPLQSLETNPNLGAIFSEPEFNKEFLSHGTFEKINSIVQNTINQSIPDEYKNNEDYRKYVVKLYTPTIIKNILAGALDPNSIKQGGQIDQNILRNVSLQTLNADKETTVQNERTKVIRKISSAINEKATNEIKAKMTEELNNISLDDFKLAESIVLQGRAGLNWRFDAAKDVGDFDKIKSNQASLETIMEGDEKRPGVKDFWTNFISNIRKYNPSSYIIAEVTEFWNYVNNGDKVSERNFDRKLSKMKDLLPDSEKGIQENQLPYIKENEFISEIGATTSSNYTAYFNSLSAILGVNPETYKQDIFLDAGNLTQLKNKTENYIKSVQPNNALLSHMFVENHDKPRILHTLPLDMSIFSKDTMKDCSQEQKDNGEIKELTENRTDYNKISAKAVAVGLLMRRTIYQIYGNDYTKKEALMRSLKNLVNGKASDSSKPSYKRAEAFGVTSYEISIRDLFKNAGYNNEDEIWNFHHTMLEKSLEMQEGLWEIMGAIVGTPTMYYGNNFAQTGFETPNRNVYVQNRNQALHEIKNRKEYRDYYNKMNAISGLYKENGLSALRDGFAVSLKYSSTTDNNHPAAILYLREKIADYARNTNQDFNGVINTLREKRNTPDEFNRFVTQDLQINPSNGNVDILNRTLDMINPSDPSPKDFVDLWPVYKYDESGSKVISVITNNGIPRRAKSNEAYNFTNEYSVKGIPIKDNQDNCPLENGTILKRKVYNSQAKRFVDDEKTYIVRDGNIQTKDGSNIIIKDTVATFYVPKNDEQQVRYKASAGIY